MLLNKYAENVELSGHGNLIHKCYNKRVLYITMMIFKWLIFNEFQEEIHKKEVFFFSNFDVFLYSYIKGLSEWEIKESKQKGDGCLAHKTFEHISKI